MQMQRQWRVEIKDRRSCRLVNVNRECRSQSITQSVCNVSVSMCKCVRRAPAHACYNTKRHVNQSKESN